MSCWLTVSTANDTNLQQIYSILPPTNLSATSRHVVSPANPFDVIQNGQIYSKSTANLQQIRVVWFELIRADVASESGPYIYG